MVPLEMTRFKFRFKSDEQDETAWYDLRLNRHIKPTEEDLTEFEFNIDGVTYTELSEEFLEKFNEIMLWDILQYHDK